MKSVSEGALQALVSKCLMDWWSWIHDFEAEQWCIHIPMPQQSNGSVLSRSLEEMIRDLRSFYTLRSVDLEYLFWKIQTADHVEAYPAVEPLAHRYWSSANHLFVPSHDGQIYNKPLLECDSDLTKVRVRCAKESALRRVDPGTCWRLFSLRGYLSHSSIEEFHSENELPPWGIPF